MVETRTIDVVPDSERHGNARSQFTLWFGANMQITAIVDGALAVVFGSDALWAIVGLTLGNILGGIVMALHSAQGPRLGLPQMISSRAQFGVLGAAIPLVLVIVMYVGFAATGTVLSGPGVQKLDGLLTSLLANGHPELISIGFLLAVWAGSRAMNVYVYAITRYRGRTDIWINGTSDHDRGRLYRHRLPRRRGRRRADLREAVGSGTAHGRRLARSG